MTILNSGLSPEASTTFIRRPRESGMKRESRAHNLTLRNLDSTVNPMSHNGASKVSLFNVNG